MKKIIILVAGTLFLLGCSSDSPSTAAALDDPDDFLVPRPFWVDIVEDFVPLP